MYVPTQYCAGVSGLSGLGDCGCNGKCGGLGLFEGGFNWDEWGFAEWATMAVGAYLILSLSGDTRRGVRSVQKGIKRRARRRELREESA